MSQKSLKTLSLLLSLLVTPSLSLVAAEDQNITYQYQGLTTTYLSSILPLQTVPEYIKQLLEAISKYEKFSVKFAYNMTKTNQLRIEISPNSAYTPSLAEKTISLKSEHLLPILLIPLCNLFVDNRTNEKIPTNLRESLNNLFESELRTPAQVVAYKQIQSALNNVLDLIDSYLKDYLKTNANKYKGAREINYDDILIDNSLFKTIIERLSDFSKYYFILFSKVFKFPEWSPDSKCGVFFNWVDDIKNELTAGKFDSIMTAKIDDHKGRSTMRPILNCLDNFLANNKIQLTVVLNCSGDYSYNYFNINDNLFRDFSSVRMFECYCPVDNAKRTRLTFGSSILSNAATVSFRIPSVHGFVCNSVFGGSHVNQLSVPVDYNGSFSDLNTWCYSMANKDLDATKPINKKNEPKKDNNYGSGNVAVLVDHADCFPRILIKKHEERNATPQTGSGTTTANPRQQSAVILKKDIVAAALAYRNDGKTSVSRCTPVTIIVDESITSIEADAFAPLKDFIVGRMVLTPSASLCQSLKTTSTSLFDRNNPQSIKVNQLILRGPNVQRFVGQQLNNVFSGARFHRVNIVAAMKSFDQASLKFLENTGVEQLYIAGPVGAVGPSSVATLAGLKRLEFNPMGQHMNWSDPEKPVFDPAHVYHFNPLYRLDNKEPAFVGKDFDWKKEYRTNSVAYAAEWPDSSFANSTLEYVNIPYYVTGFKAKWCSDCQNLKEVECYRFKGNRFYNWETLSKDVMSFFSKVPAGCTINFASGHMTQVEKNCLDGLSPELKNSIKIKISLNHAQFKKDGLSKDILPLPNIVGVGLPWNYPYPLKEDLFEYCNNGQINKDFELWMSDDCNIPATSISDVFAKTTGLNSWFINFSDGPCLQFHKHVEEPTTSTK